MNDSDFNHIIKSWEVEQKEISSEKLFEKLSERKKISRTRAIFVNLALIVLLTAGGLFSYNSISQQKQNKNNILFTGNNSDIVCYTILMDVNYEK